VPGKFVYEGNFKDDLFDGYGEYKSKEYNYFGNYSCGKKCGKGKEINLIKNIEYEGDFKDDEKNGFGKEKTSDGTIYIGDFKNNQKHGTGNLILAGVNSWKYKGQFKNDKISGKGRFRWNNHKEYIGEWDNNELSGYGILINKNDRYVGYFAHNNKDGYGATFYNGQSALLGKWKKDNIEGNAILITFSDLEKSNNYNVDKDENIEKNFQFIKTLKGEIIQNHLENEELTNFKSSKEYNNMILLYKQKFYPNYIKSNEKFNNEKTMSINNNDSGSI